MADGSRSRRLAWLMVGAGALLLAATVALYVVVVVIPAAAVERLRTAAEGIASDLDALVHVRPRITVNGTMVVDRTTPILELATVAEDRTLDYRWQHEWLGSTKQLDLHGRYRLRAGFDLRQPFSIAVAETGVEITLPPAALLTCELLSLEERGASGWWNGLSEADRDQARIGFLATARGSDEAHALVARAQDEAERQLREVVRRHLGERPVRFHSTGE